MIRWCDDPTTTLKVHIWIYRRSDDHPLPTIRRSLFWLFLPTIRRSFEIFLPTIRRSWIWFFWLTLTDDPTITIWIFWRKLPTIRRSRFSILSDILAKTETLNRIRYSDFLCIPVYFWFSYSRIMLSAYDSRTTHQRTIHVICLLCFISFQVCENRWNSSRSKSYLAVCI